MLSILYTIPVTFMCGRWCVRDLRALYGFSQSEVAKLLGISRPAYVAIERGTARVYYDTVLKLGRLFKRCVGQLCSDDGYLFQESDQCAYDELMKYYADHEDVEL